MKVLKFKYALLASLVLSISACGAKEEETEEDESSVSAASGSSGSGSTGLEEASIEDMKVSKSIRVDLPDFLDQASSASLNLQSTAKSQEMCMMGETISQVTSRLEGIANFFCHIEVESDKISFGTKYKIEFQGQEFGRVYAARDDDAGTVTLGFCSNDENGQNKEVIELTELTDEGVAGSIVSKGSEGTNSWASSIVFDATEEDTLVLTAKEAFSGSSDEAFKRKVIMNLLPAGVSTISLAASGTWQGSTFSERGYGKFDGTFGSAVFANSGSYQGNEFSFTRRAFFSEDGSVASQSDNAAMAEGGDVYVEATELPDLLASTFAPDSPAGWVGEDCDGTDETIELNPDSAEHQACDGDRNEDWEDCWNQDKYQAGSEIQ